MEQFTVNAFTGKGCLGNPAAVVISDEWLPEAEMQRIATEKGLSDTAFAVKQGGRYGLRWFTPTREIDLCGHATLATGFVIMRFVEPELEEVVFETASGELRVRKIDTRFEMDFPAYKLTPYPLTLDIAEALGARPREVFLERDLVCVFDDAQTVVGLKPDFEKVKALPGLMCHVTARGGASEQFGCGEGMTFDCVSRSFGPKLGADEEIKTQNWIQFNVACA